MIKVNAESLEKIRKFAMLPPISNDPIKKYWEYYLAFVEFLHKLKTDPRTILAYSKIG